MNRMEQDDRPPRFLVFAFRVLSFGASPFFGSSRKTGTAPSRRQKSSPQIALIAQTCADLSQAGTGRHPHEPGSFGNGLGTHSLPEAVTKEMRDRTRREEAFTAPGAVCGDLPDQRELRQ